MNTKKHTNKLQKSSLLFFQLGLVLALLTVYVAVEHKTEIHNATVIKNKPSVDEEYAFHQYDNYKVEEKKVVQKKAIVLKKASLDKIKITNKETAKETPLPFDNPDEKAKPTNVDLTKLVDVNEGEELDPDFFSVQEKPIFPGCEKVKESERSACFEKKITKFVSRKFNAGLAPTLGLSSGKKRIFVEFLITKTGEIEITNASAPHVRLKKEGERVVNKLPIMIPGKQNGKEVNVKYLLPITFDVN